MKRYRCKNCYTRRGHLWHVESEGCKYQLCDPCREIWEDYLVALGPIWCHRNLNGRPERSLFDPAIRVLQGAFDQRAQHGFQDTQCRVDVFQYITTKSTYTLSLKLNFMSRDDNRE